MEKRFCAKCGALLGKNEYNFLDKLDGVVCDACSHETARAVRNGMNRFPARYAQRPAACAK